MIQVYLKNTIILITAIILQVLVFDNIRLGGYINPYFYIVFILFLPFETPSWLLLVFAFFLGFIIDIFNSSLGMHTSSTVFIAFLRPFALQSFAPREGYEKGTLPRVDYYGLSWFVKYAALLILAHHFLLFTIEVFRFADFFQALIRILASSLVTLLIVVLSQFFIFRK